MCGIAGILSPNHSAISNTVLQKMAHVLRHRGPDGEGYGMYETDNAKIGLGHRRLSIIDLTAGGHQPKTFGSLHLTFNGEIYNYIELREELITLGHKFTTTSDTEVVINAYRAWGVDCQNHFNGMWAFVLVVVHQISPAHRP